MKDLSEVTECLSTGSPKGLGTKTSRKDLLRAAAKVRLDLQLRCSIQWIELVCSHVFCSAQTKVDRSPDDVEQLLTLVRPVWSAEGFSGM